jgi:hypothetical protein
MIFFPPLFLKENNPNQIDDRRINPHKRYGKEKYALENISLHSALRGEVGFVYDAS